MYGILLILFFLVSNENVVAKSYDNLNLNSTRLLSNEIEKNLGYKVNFDDNTDPKLVSSYIYDIDQWNLSSISCPTPPYASLDSLESRGTIQLHRKGCLDNVRAPKHSKHRNQFHGRGELPPGYLKGTTYYINEYMAIGHALMDIEVIQVLQSAPVERIVLQRAPCATRDLCANDKSIGTWESFFKAFYAIMIEAFRPGIPIYMRFNDQDYLSARFLSIHSESGEILERHEENNRLDLKHDQLCFDVVVKSPKDVPNQLTNRHAVSNMAAQQFRKTTYNMIRNFIKYHNSTSSTSKTETSTSPSSLEIIENSLESHHPIVITYVYRSVQDRRHPANPEIILHLLEKKYAAESSKYRVQHMPINSTQKHTAQIQIMAQSDVIITEHGGFNSNVVYMRNGSLLIMLRGNYQLGMNHDFLMLHAAQSFGVFLRFVITDHMRDHEEQKMYNISGLEAERVVQVVDNYCMFLGNVHKPS